MKISELPQEDIKKIKNALDNCILLNEKSGFEKGIEFLLSLQYRKPPQSVFSKLEETNVKPPQYQIGIDTFERMEKNCTLEERLAFVKGSIDAYLWRKKGQDKQDFEKIINYANWAIKQME